MRCLDFSHVPVIFLKCHGLNMLFRSQYTSEYNFDSISSCGEIHGANVCSKECLDFTCDLVIFLKCHGYKLVVSVQYTSESSFNSISSCGEILDSN
jgi:hypothetical protein